MAWQTSTTITNATGSNLTAGAEATGADYGAIKVQEGGILDTATVSSAGYVYVGSAGSATELTVLKGGSAVVSGGYLSGGTFYGNLRLSRNTAVNASVYDVAISSGGYLWTQPGTATIADARIYSAGSAFFNDTIYLTNVVVEQGGKFAMGGNTLYIVDDGGKTSIPVGAVYSGTGANKFYQWGSDFAVANGVVSGLSIGAATVGGKNSGGVNFNGSGLTVDGATIAGAYNASGVFQSRSAGIYNGAVKDAVVSNLGAVVLHRSSYISNATVLAGGTIYLSNGNSATAVTIETGGRLTVRGGAWILGSNNRIAAGTWSGCADFYTDGNGVGHDLTLNGSTVNFADITLSGVAISAGNGSLCVRSGATACGVSAAASGAAIVHSGGTISGWSFDVSGKGSVYSGGSAFAVRVYAGGSMALSGAAISGITLDNATMTLNSGARVDSAAVSAGGTLTMETSSFLSGAVIGNGGSLYVSNTNSVTGITTEAGATLIMRGGAKMIGNNNHIAADTWSGGGAFHTDENGVGHDLTLNGVTIHFIDMTLSGVSMMSNGQIRVSSGTTVYGLSGTGRTSTYIYAGGEVRNFSLLYGLSGATYQAGTAYITSSAFVDGLIADSTAVIRLASAATLLNANVAAGATLVYSSAAKLGGEDTDIAAGTISAYAADGTLVALTAAHIDSGVAQEFELRGANGKSLEVDFLDGITVGSANVGSGARLVLGSGVTVGGTLNVSSGGEAVGAVVAAGGKLFVSSAVTLNDATILEGAASAYFSSATINGLVIRTENTALTAVSARNTVVNDLDLRGGAVSGASARISAMAGTVLNNGLIDYNGQAIVVVNAETHGTFIGNSGGDQLWGGAAYGTVVGSGGSQTVHNSRGAFGAAYDTVVLSGGRLTGNRYVTGGVTYWGGITSRATINSGGSFSVNSNNSAYDFTARTGAKVTVGDVGVGFGGSNTRIDRGALFDNPDAYTDAPGRLVNYSVVNGYEFNALSGLTLASGTVSSGGTLVCRSGATLDGVRVVSGAQLTLEAGATTKEITLDFLGKAGNTAALVNDLSLLSSDAVVKVTGLALNNSYTITDNGDANARFVVNYLGFDTEIGAGGEYVNPLNAGRKFTVAADGTTVRAEACDMRSETLTTEAANLITSGATVNVNDRALLWENVAMAAGDAVTFADDSIAGDAWLDIDSASLAAGATLYGATGNYTGTIRYLVHGSGGTIGNFAAGATSNGKVGGVELVAYKNTFAGVTYLGGQGTVTGLVSAVISSGVTLEKDFYAGALANYAKTSQTTGVGGIDTRIAMVTGADRVKGNIYGASAVKAGTIATAANTAALHTVGDVTVTLDAATLTDGKCVFAGGYATGHDTAKLAPVYTVGSVTANVNGGDWGNAHGGRGIFGGAMASDNIASGAEATGVCARVGDVNISIADGTMGNVYGGGWAQRGARSIVGDVNISIAGGTIANVFGGGSHSTSGGSTETGAVTITVSGGSITGSVYARGQLEGDATGAAEVIFTGATNFGCEVYGYSHVGGDDEGAALRFSAYTGEFSGKLGGFNGITLDGGTAMTLATVADNVSNGAWIFDVSDRDAGLAGTALLNWTAADFANDTITLALGTTAAAEWSLVSAASTTAYNKFNVDGIAAGLVLDQAIGNTGTVYDGWGFTLEESTLKFKNLA